MADIPLEEWIWMEIDNALNVKKITELSGVNIPVLRKLGPNS